MFLTVFIAAVVIEPLDGVFLELGKGSGDEGFDGIKLVEPENHGQSGFAVFLEPARMAKTSDRFEAGITSLELLPPAAVQLKATMAGS